MTKQERQQKRIDRLTASEDIRYRGPLSYRGFKILGWACIVLSQVVVLLNLQVRLDPGSAPYLRDPITIMSLVAEMALPFLLIANFAQILNHSEGYGSQLLRYGALSVLVGVIPAFLFSRYVVGTAALLTGDRARATEALYILFNEGSETHYVAFNIFIDLFLCTLLMYFLNYRPKRVFVGKWLTVFRCFAILPVAYEAASITLRFLAVYEKIRLPFIVFPFLTVKPLISFLVFIVLAVFIKTRELRFRKGGKTHEEYLEFLKTNRNSFHFSCFTALTLAIAGIVDILTVIIYLAVDSGGQLDADFMVFVPHLSAMGVGKSATLLLLAPIMLLFCYTKTHKNKTFDLLIPAIGVACIVVVYFEGMYQGVLMAADTVRQVVREIVSP